MTIKLIIISVPLVIQVICMINKFFVNNHLKQYKVISTSFEEAKVNKSIILNSLKRKLGKMNQDQSSEEIKDIDTINSFKTSFINEKDNSKYFSFTNELNGLSLIQIFNNKQIILYQMTKQSNTPKQCWKDEIEGTIKGAVSSNDKIHLAVFYLSKSSEYRIRYYHSISCNQRYMTDSIVEDNDDVYNDIYDDFIIESNKAISSMAISHNIIILSFAYDSKIEYSIIKKEYNEFKWSFIYQKTQEKSLSYVYYTQSLKFTSQDTINISFLQIYLSIDKNSNKVYQLTDQIALNINNPSHTYKKTRLITSEIPNEELDNTEQFKQNYLKQKTMSNGNINGNLLFEIVKGKIIHAAIKPHQIIPQVYLLYETSNKTEMIASDTSGKYNAIKYTNDPKIYFALKVESTKAYDSYSQLESISIDTHGAIPLSFSFNESELFILMNDGNCILLDMKKSPFAFEVNLNFVKIILIAMICIIWIYAMFEERLKDIFSTVMNGQFDRRLGQRTIC